MDAGSPAPDPDLLCKQVASRQQQQQRQMVMVVGSPQSLLFN